MSLLIMIVVLASCFFWQHASKYRQHAWFNAYLSQVQPLVSGDFGSFALVKVLLVVGFIPLMIWILLILLGISLSFTAQLLHFIVSVLIVWWCLGKVPNDYPLQDYLTAIEHRDLPAASNTAEEILGYTPPDTLPDLTRAVSGHLFIKQTQDIFNVLFWYLLLGPAGALFYRLVAYTEQFGSVEASGVCARILPWLEYIPVRLVAFTFALMGHFVAVVGVLFPSFIATPELNTKLISDAGLAAIGADMDENKPMQVDDHLEALQLIYRSIVTWLVVVAIMELVHGLS